jgi:ribonuclease PH
MERSHGRAQNETRPITFQRAYTTAVPGSVLTTFGKTVVLCTASVTDGVPNWLAGKGKGWLTAEYSMLPGASKERKARDRAGKTDGRSIEIQRLIGRALRSVIDFSRMTERTIWIDCDVLQADGGTRTASVCGAWIALYDALVEMDQRRVLRSWPLKDQVAGISIGVVGGEVLCDLDYPEDSRAEVDMNLVMTGKGELIEVQGTAEGAPFQRSALDAMLAVGEAAIRRIFELQKAAIGKV